MRHSSHFRWYCLIGVCFAVLLLIIPDSAYAVERMFEIDSILDPFLSEYKDFYSSERLGRIGLALGLGAVISNSDIDSDIQHWYEYNARSSTSDSISKDIKYFGERKYFIPLTLLAASLNYYNSESPIGKWGVNTAKAYVRGAPAVLLMQGVAGGSRPGETDHGSKWRVFKDNNSVSGHAFFGAVPFLTFAYMNNDNLFIKYIAYAASLTVGWSRVNDNAHYTSQALLGWYMAWESVDSIFETGKDNKTVSIGSMTGIDGNGILIRISW